MKATKPATATPEPVEILDKARLVKLDQIKPSKDNPRKSIDQEALKALAESIRTQGLLQPILIRQVYGTGGFEIIAGERRYRAAKLAGLTEISACIVKMTDEQAKDARLVENDQREDISPLERAAAYQERLDAGQPIEELAKVVGKSVSSVREALLLGRCPPDLAEAVANGTVPSSTAALVCRVPNQKLRERITLHVLAGEHWHGDRRPPRTVDGNVETLSFRDTKRMIQDHCMIELKGASFDPGDADLVKGAGTCEACPNRLGNLQKLDPSGFGPGRADVCMDPECYQKKTKAAAELKVKEAEAAGRKVLSATEANKAFNSYNGDMVGYNARYLDLDQTAGYTSGNKTYRQILAAELKNGLAEKVVIGIDRTGKSHDLIDKKDAKADLAKHGVKITIPSAASRSSGSSSSGSNVDWEKRHKEQEAKRKKDEQIRKAVRQAEYARIGAGAEAAWVGRQGQFVRFLGRFAVALSTCPDAIGEVLGVKTSSGDYRANKQALLAAVDAAPLHKLAKIICCAQLDFLRDTDETELIAELAKLCVVDLEQIEKSVRAELDPPLNLEAQKAGDRAARKAGKKMLAGASS